MASISPPESLGESRSEAKIQEGSSDKLALKTRITWRIKK
jgi:hypothetical protein